MDSGRGSIDVETSERRRTPGRDPRDIEYFAVDRFAVNRRGLPVERKEEARSFHVERRRAHIRALRVSLVWVAVWSRRFVVGTFLTHPLEKPLMRSVTICALVTDG
jgi:hypothetical protein